MINKFLIKNYLGEVLPIEMFEDRYEAGKHSGLLIRSVTGLGPPKASINTSEISTNDGSIFNTSRAQQRNIVFNFIFQEIKDENGIITKEGTIEKIRHKTYEFFHIKKPVTIVIFTDTRILMTTGYVETNEPSIWSEQEGCQISIICPDSYLYRATSDGELYETTMKMGGVEPLFQFRFNSYPEVIKISDPEQRRSDKAPSSNKDARGLLRMGMRGTTSTRDIYYLGDAETGVFIRIHIGGSVGNISIEDDETHERIEILNALIKKLTGNNLRTGDVIEISTFQGEKYVHLISNSVTTNILNCVEITKGWIRVTNGRNRFVLNVTSGSEFVTIDFVSHVLYEGV